MSYTLNISTINCVRSNSRSLKYQRFTLSGCKDIGIRTFKFVEKLSSFDCKKKTPINVKEYVYNYFLVLHYLSCSTEQISNTLSRKSIGEKKKLFLMIYDLKVILYLVSLKDDKALKKITDFIVRYKTKQ